jgi:hypothetical protein
MKVQLSAMLLACNLLAALVAPRSSKVLRNIFKSLLIVGGIALLAGAACATIITDPVGDASGHADVVAISGSYDHTSLFLSAQFEAGTLDRNNFAFFFGLDTDENPATGEQPFFPIGSEFVVDFNSLASTSRATIFQQHVGPVGSVPISFTVDSFSVTVPLSMLGNDDGAALFGLAAGVPTDASSFHAFDYAPDSSRGGGPLGGPTSAISVPDTGGTFALLCCACAILASVRFLNREKPF